MLSGKDARQALPSSAARTFGATGPAAEDDFFCKLRLRGAKQATPHQTPPSTPSTIFRKTATVVHSDVKAPSIQKIARKLLWFRFFVLLLGQAIRRKRRESRCCSHKRGSLLVQTAIKRVLCRVVTTPGLEGVHPRPHAMTGVDLLHYGVGRVATTYETSDASRFFLYKR